MFSTRLFLWLRFLGGFSKEVLYLDSYTMLFCIKRDETEVSESETSEIFQSIVENIMYKVSMSGFMKTVSKNSCPALS